MLLRMILRFRERRERVRKDATELTARLGDDAAYAEARSKARASRAKQDRTADRHWSRVAVEIADRAGFVIGEKAADRYAKDPL
jgi:hypothetical protein